MRKTKEALTHNCRAQIQGVKDTQDLLSGNWKCVIIAALYYNKIFRFMDLVRHIDGITPKVLSKELKDLEMNHLVKRTVINTMPITVQYELTRQGKSLDKIIAHMGDWGMSYRKSVVKK